MIDYPKCPKCGNNEKVIKNGTAKRKQRFRCKICKCDFIPNLCKNERQASVNYIEIKLFCVLLYFCGWSAKTIFENILKLRCPKLTNYKIIYEWANKYKKFKTVDNSFVRINISQAETLAIFFKETVYQNTENNIFYFPICDISKDFKIKFFKHSLVKMNNNAITSKNFIYYFFLYFLSNCKNNNELTKLFENIHITESNIIFNSKIYFNYKYENYFTSLSECTYSEFAEHEKQVKNIKKYEKIKNKTIHCILFFDKSFKTLNINFMIEA